MKTHSHKVLVVDDDLDTIRLLEVFLQRKGYNTQAARDGLEAVEKYHSFSPCLIILDINMPKMSGMDVLEVLRKESSFHRVRTVVLSASSLLCHKTQCLEGGADDYVTKPFSPEELLARVQAQLRSNEVVESFEGEQEKYRNLSYQDSLTEQHNRRYLDEFLPKIWSISRREKTPLSCAMIDIDYFKKVNDTYSHQAGDAVIQHLAKILEEETRCSDIVARYGGEEFMIVMSNTRLEGARHCTEEIRNKVEHSPAVFRGQEIKFTISAGVSERSQPGISTSEELSHTADKALYVAKTEGRNQVRVFFGERE